MSALERSSVRISPHGIAVSKLKNTPFPWVERLMRRESAPYDCHRWALTAWIYRPKSTRARSAD